MMAAIMRFQAKINEPVIMLDIATGKKEHLQVGKTYDVEYQMLNDREYLLITGTNVGSVRTYWLQQESQRALKLVRTDGPTIDGVQLPITTRAQLSKHQIENLVVGKIVKGRFLCNKCALKKDLNTPVAFSVYPVNILPYSQDCHDCGLVVFDMAKKKEGGYLTIFEKPLPEARKGYKRN